MAKYLDDTGLAHLVGKLQPKLASGTNIKTINNQSLLGSGNIIISGGSTKYRHNMVVSFYGGSGTGYCEGVISFSFVDSHSGSYEDTSRDMDYTDFQGFLATHLGMTGSKYMPYPVSGNIKKGSSSSTYYFLSAITYSYGVFYAGGSSVNSSNTRYIGIELAYMSSIWNTAYFALTDVVEVI